MGGLGVGVCIFARGVKYSRGAGCFVLYIGNG